MPQQFELQLQELLEKILLMGGTAESMIQLAIRGLLEHDTSLADQVLEKERQVNRLEIEVDDRVVGLIVQYQPVARDARFATAALRVATDLERVGDQAVNICQNTLHALEAPPAELPPEMAPLAGMANKMIADSLNALATRDVSLAEQVLMDEKTADRLRDEIFRTLLRGMITDPLNAQRYLSLVLVSRNLERIADHATNIAEEAIYLTRGQDVRHQFDKPLRGW